MSIAYGIGSPTFAGMDVAGLDSYALIRAEGTGTLEIRKVTPRDEDVVSAAGSLFDHPIDIAATRAFLADDRHHLLLALIGDEPAGFVTAVELLHPDKPKPEVFIYELGVDPAYRRRSVATVLLLTLQTICHDRGCGEMFVLTETDNIAAMSTYRAAGGRREADSAMFYWDWRSLSPTGSQSADAGKR